jgi:hypothetical protein
VKHLPVKSVPLQYLTVDPRAIPTREAERIKNLKLVNCIGEFVLLLRCRFDSELAGFYTIPERPPLSLSDLGSKPGVGWALQYYIAKSITLI